jgi:hypothetical protein
MLKRVVSYSVVALVGWTIVGAESDTRFAILPTPEGRAVIDQCSRSAPEHVTHFWRPTVAQVEAAEKALPAFLHAKGHKDWLRGSFRQYVGVVVAGRRLIYLNAFPAPTPGTADARDARTKAYIVCDGGSSFWGAEYDPATGRFQHLDSNGVA